MFFRYKQISIFFCALCTVYEISILNVDYVIIGTRVPIKGGKSIFLTKPIVLTG